MCSHVVVKEICKSVNMVTCKNTVSTNKHFNWNYHNHNAIIIYTATPTSPPLKFEVSRVNVILPLFSLHYRRPKTTLRLSENDTNSRITFTISTASNSSWWLWHTATLFKRDWVIVERSHVFKRRNELKLRSLVDPGQTLAGSGPLWPLRRWRLWSLLFCTLIGFLQFRHRTRFRDSFCLASVFKCLFTYLLTYLLT